MDKATTSCRVGKSKQEYGKTAKESSGYSEHNHLEFLSHTGEREMCISKDMQLFFAVFVLFSPYKFKGLLLKHNSETQTHAQIH